MSQTFRYLISPANIPFLRYRCQSEVTRHEILATNHRNYLSQVSHRLEVPLLILISIWYDNLRTHLRCRIQPLISRVFHTMETSCLAWTQDISPRIPYTQIPSLHVRSQHCTQEDRTTRSVCLGIAKRGHDTLATVVQQ